MLEKSEKEMLEMSIGSFQPEQEKTKDSSGDDSNNSNNSIMLEEVDKLQEVVDGLKKRNIDFNPRLDELRKQQMEMEKEREEINKSIASLSNSEEEGDGDKEASVGLKPTLSAEPNVPDLDDDDDDEKEEDDLTMHTLTSSVDTFATRSIDAGQPGAPGAGGGVRESGTASLLTNYSLSESVNEQSLSFNAGTTPGKQEGGDGDDGGDDDDDAGEIKLADMSLEDKEDGLVGDNEDEKPRAMVEETPAPAPLYMGKYDDDDNDDSGEEDDDAVALSMHTLKTEDEGADNTKDELASALSFTTESDMSTSEAFNTLKPSSVEEGAGGVATLTVDKELEDEEDEEVEMKNDDATTKTGFISNTPLDDDESKALQSQALDMSADSLTASILEGDSSAKVDAGEAEDEDDEGGDVDGGASAKTGGGKKKKEKKKKKTGR